MENHNHLEARGKFLLVLLFIMTFIAPSLQKDVKNKCDSTIIGCTTCSEKFLVSSYFEKHDSFVNSEFEDFIDEKLPLANTCKRLQHDVSYPSRLSAYRRHLSGEGSHRHLITTISVDVHSVISRLGAQSCQWVLIEKLPAGVFADPFELQHLVQHDAFSDAAVFGDTNLELPTALSNRSVVEVHKDIHHTTTSNNLWGLEFTVELPLHARYPPLDYKGYSRVVMEQPELMMRCAVKHQNEDCSSVLFRWNATLSGDIIWHIPCGNEKLTKIVSAVTFVSALVSALLIIYFSMCHFAAPKDFKSL